MRDIDFEELDKAVGSYLENGVVPSVQDKNSEVFSRIETQIEHSREQRQIVFARKAPQSASQLHQITNKKRDLNIDKNTEKPNKKVTFTEKMRVRILDDFSTPVPPEHHRENFGVPFSIKEEKIAFESPILETYGGEKLVRNARKPENSPIRKKIMPKNDKHSAEKVEEAQEKVEIKNTQVTTPSRVEFYAGVYKIGEDDNKLRIFHGERSVDVPERRSLDTNFNSFKNDEPEKVMPEISSSSFKNENQVRVEKNEESQQEDFGKDNIKVKINTDIKADIEPAKDYKAEKKITIIESDSQERTEEEKISDEVSEKVIIQPVDEIEKPKTPFVQNPQIEKRPLGATQTQAKSFDMRRPSFDTNRNNSQKTTITKELRQAKMSTPILSTDEYSAPVKHKKKSGFGIVLAILAILLLGAAAGFIAYLVAFQ